MNAIIPVEFFKNTKFICGWGGCNAPTKPGDLISLILPNILVLAGVIFFFLIVGAGFMLIKNAGGDANAQDTAKAKAAVTFAVIGFLLVISAYFILQIIGVVTGVDFLKLRDL